MPRRAPRFDPRPARAAPRLRDESKSERDAFYSSARWRRLRDAFLDANPLCLECLEAGRITGATIAHHVVERLIRPDLALTWSNLAATCSPCHTAHHKRAPHKPNSLGEAPGGG